MFGAFFNNLSMWVEAVVDIIVEFLNRMISFFKDVVDWFRKKINGVRSKIAYIITMDRIRTAIKQMKIGDLLSQDTVKVVDGLGIYNNNNSVVQVVHDEAADKITEMRIIASSVGMDNHLREIMKGHDAIRCK